MQSRHIELAINKNCELFIPFHMNTNIVLNFQMNSSKRKRRALNSLVDAYMELSDSSSEFPVKEFRHSQQKYVKPRISSDMEGIELPIPDYEDSLSDYSLSSETDCEDDCILDDLREVFKEISITQNDLTKLLKVLNKYHPELPTDARTLKQTPPEKSSLKSVSPGNYYHFGLEKGISFVVEKLSIPVTEKVLQLQVNIDGLPIFKSSAECFWPILCSLYGYSGSVFLVGAYAGTKKPDDCSKFLENFIDELKHVLQFGVKEFSVHFRCCCCDTPARHFILNVKSHGGYFGCERCCQRGESIEGRRVFLTSDSQKRTNTSFRMREQLEHHKGESPFEKLSEIDMVCDFPQDYMHSICKGLIMKLLEELRSGRFRLSVQLLRAMSNSLISLRSNIPAEFCRRPRSIFHLGTWKATELRLFALYLGPFVLPKFCDDRFTKCFTTLTVILRIFCTSNANNDYLLYAEKLVLFLHAQFRNLFGEKFFVYNVHSLIHLFDDVKKFGEVDSFSCFQYENFLRFIKRKLRSPKFPLQQLVKRVGETDVCLGHCNLPGVGKCLYYETDISEEIRSEFNFMNVKFYKKLVLSSCILQADDVNAFVILKGDTFKPFKVACFIQDHQKEISVLGYQLKIIGNVFEEPLPSEKVGIVKVQAAICKTKLKLVKLSDIFQKAMLLDEKYFATILHSQLSV